MQIHALLHGPSFNSSGKSRSLLIKIFLTWLQYLVSDLEERFQDLNAYLDLKTLQWLSTRDGLRKNPKLQKTFHPMKYPREKEAMNMQRTKSRPCQ